MVDCLERDKGSLVVLKMSVYLKQRGRGEGGAGREIGVREGGGGREGEEREERGGGR